MNPRDELSRQLELWERLTRTEGEALRAGDWHAVALCQGEKTALQHTIDDLKAAAAKHDRRAEIQNLIALEEANLALVKDHLKRDLQRQAELSRAHRKLGQVHSYYAGGRPPTWQCYS